MAVGIAVCLLLGGLFLYLAARQYRRGARWCGAVRLLAVVKSVRYQEARQRETEINDHKSSTEATLCFTDRGRAYEERRQFPGIILAPVPGQKLPILFDRDSREWILRKEARTHWCVFAALGCLCTAAGLALLLDGSGLLAELAAYRVEAPNLAGSTVCALIGLICGACAYACVRGLIPSLLRTAAEPAVWLLKARVLHRFEEVDAQCVGIIWRETGDEDVSYYPFFQYTVEGEQLHWFPSHRMSRKRYRPGGRYTLYRDTVTGGCALRPGAMELLSAPFSLIPIGFFLLFILSLAACAAGTLCIAAIGFARLLGA